MPLRTLRPILLRVQAQGISVGKLLDELGIVPTAVFTSDAVCDAVTFAEVWRRGFELSKDPALPLHAASVGDMRILSAMPHDSEYVPAQLFAQSDTVERALSRLQRFWGIYNPNSRITLERTSERVIVKMEFVEARFFSAEFAEFVILLFARGLCDLAATPLQLKSVKLRRRRPEQVDEYEKLIGDMVQFDAEEDSFAIDAARLTTALTGSKPALVELLERKAESQAGAGSPVVERVRAIMRAMLLEGAPTAEQTAARMNMSVRTLARRLDDEGTSHRQLLEQIRMEQAAHHLSEDTLPVEQVGLLLGFSQASAFHRAFKRWSGVSPSEYRKSKLKP